MKSLIYLGAVFAILCVAGCASDQDQGKGGVGPEYRYNYGEDSGNPVQPPSPDNPVNRRFGPGRNFP
jgi:hypothetical protein